MPNRLALTALLLWPALAGLTAGAASAQAPGFSDADWKRVETEHYLFIYPEPLREWALHMAERMESVHEQVAALVGNEPRFRITVLVDDPSNVSNGSMNPGPLLYMWPTPPNPRSMIGENRSWPEILAVHEFAHAAHLFRVSRNPRDRFLFSLMPIRIDPILSRVPRWAIEGYATYVEGRLTGSGRPHGVWRPAVLRTWALEGQLPSYGGMSSSTGVYGGAMAYLMGSAFYEWLVDREEGDESVLPDVWARLTARQKRSFGGAFAGVFGASPDELYGLFTVDVTERALAVRDRVEAAGGVEAGELFQRYDWYVGDPAVSPDGAHLAIDIQSRNGPSRIVVFSTTPDTATTRELERRAEIFERDPEDVEPVEIQPRTQRPAAVLRPFQGAAYSNPVFLPDSAGVLVVRRDFFDNARTRTDLFVWDWAESGAVRRVTRGAGIREAAPSPDGTWAAGSQCLAGRCSIVHVDLATGSVTTIASGGILRAYYHPRISPDGRTIVASVQEDGQWHLVAMNDDGSDERRIGPADGAARFDAEFLPDGRLVLTSAAGGIHDIEVLDPRDGSTRPITRVETSAVAPAPTPDGDVFFLELHSRGWNLRRTAVDATVRPEVTVVEPVLSPAAPVGVEPGATFPAADIGPERPYGIGPRSWVYMPFGTSSDRDRTTGLALRNTDPIGKLVVEVSGAYGEREGWSGGSAGALWRGFRPSLRLDGFWARQRPETALGPYTVEYGGGSAALELASAGLTLGYGVRAGGSLGVVNAPSAVDLDRRLGWGTVDIRLRQQAGERTLTERIEGHGSTGRTGDLEWSRWTAAMSLQYQGGDIRVAGSAMMAETGAPAGSFERLSVGGLPPQLFDPALLSQRIGMPALPQGWLTGGEVHVGELEVEGLTGPVTAFLWYGDAIDDGLDRLRLAGVKAGIDMAEVPYLLIPPMSVHGGIARILDGPWEGRWRGWLAAGITR